MNGEWIKYKYDSRVATGILRRKIHGRLNGFVKDSIWTWWNTVVRNFVVRAAALVQQKVYKIWILEGDSQGLAKS